MMRRSNERRGRLGRTATLGLLALLCVVGTGAAQADLCSDCRQPTEAELEASEGFELKRRMSWLGIWRKDYCRVEGGSCDIEIVGDMRIEKKGSILAIRGQGTAWNCPHSNASGTVSVSIASGDSTEWSISQSGSVSGQVLGLGLSATLTAAVAKAHKVEEVTLVSHNIRARWCHVIPWAAMFDVADFEAKAEVKVTRTWKWWTGNPNTGREVHAKGTCDVSCGSGEAVLTRSAALSGRFYLQQTACRDAACSHVITKDIGFMPPNTEDHEDEHPLASDEPGSEAGAPPEGPASSDGNDNAPADR